MNPYEKTVEEMKRQSEGPKRFLKTAAGMAGTALGASSFSPVLLRAAPFLSQYIPEDLAIKGLTKVSPSFGKFIKSAIGAGYDFNQVKDFIGQQIDESKEQTKEDRNIIEQYSPELYEFMKEKISSGEDPIRAAALAIFDKKNNFESIIRKIEKDHKTNWSDLVQTIFGSQVQQKESPQDKQQSSSANWDKIAQSLQSLLEM